MLMVVILSYCNTQDGGCGIEITLFFHLKQSLLPFLQNK
jgi:hypothetical protein